MIVSRDRLNDDAIASCLLDTLCHLRHAQDCTELLSLMLELLENPGIGTPKRLQILIQQCEAVWFDVQDSTTVGITRLSKLCDPPCTSSEPKSKTGSSVLEP